MMFFKKKKPFVRFTNLMPGVESVHPIIQTKELRTDWIRQAALDYRDAVKNNTEVTKSFNTVSKCPGILGLFKVGFIVPAPIDFVITTRNDSNERGIFEWECPVNYQLDNQPYIDGHSKDQLYNFMPFRQDTLSTVIKVNTRWKVSMSPDIALLQIPIPYPDHNIFTAVHGILDGDSSIEVNVQLMWHKKNEKVLIKAGTPLCQYIPIPKKLDVDLRIEQATDKDRYITSAWQYLCKKSYNRDGKTFKDQAKKLIRDNFDNS
jgi:hypothetical protein